MKPTLFNDEVEVYTIEDWTLDTCTILAITATILVLTIEYTGLVDALLAYLAIK